MRRIKINCMSKTLPHFQGCVREDYRNEVKKVFFSGELQMLPVTYCDLNNVIKSFIEAFALDILKNTMTVIGTLLSVVKQQINYLYIYDKIQQELMMKHLVY